MNKKKDSVKIISRLWAMPDSLSGPSAEFYTRAGRELIKGGVLSELDKEAFIVMCSTYKLMIDSLAEIYKSGVNVEGGRDPIKKNPAFTTYKSASDIFLRFAKEFCITPAARKSFNVDIELKPNRLDDFLNRKIQSTTK